MYARGERVIAQQYADSARDVDRTKVKVSQLRDEPSAQTSSRLCVAARTPREGCASVQVRSTLGGARDAAHAAPC
jgi:hypothetical protein